MEMDPLRRTHRRYLIGITTYFLLILPSAVAVSAEMRPADVVYSALLAQCSPYKTEVDFAAYSGVLEITGIPEPESYLYWKKHLSESASTFSKKEYAQTDRRIGGVVTYVDYGRDYSANDGRTDLKDKIEIMVSFRDHSPTYRRRIVKASGSKAVTVYDGFKLELDRFNSAFGGDQQRILTSYSEEDRDEITAIIEETFIWFLTALEAGARFDCG